MMRLTIAKRLYFLVGIFFLGLSAMAITMNMKAAQNLTEQKSAELISLVESATSVIKGKYEAAQAGKLTTEEAKQQAIAAIRDMRYRGKEYFLIGQMDGVMVMHAAMPKLEGQNLNHVKDANGVAIFPETIKIVKAESAGFLNYMWPKAGEETPSHKLTYVKGFEPWGWFVVTGVYMDDLEAILWSNTEITLIFGALTLMVCLAFTWVTLRSILPPMRSLKQVMVRLAANETIDQVPAEDRTDELGEMAQAVKTFRDMNLERQHLTAEQEKTRAADATRQAEIDQLIESFRTDAATELKVVAEQMSRLQSTAGSLTNLSQSTADRSSQAQTAASLASSNVQTVAAASEEFAASISEIGRQVDQATNAVNTAMVTTGAANERVGSLAAAANQIGEVVSLIRDIAEQTNLLALNATIEAARAGEMGKGFAVVAAEVKELATQTSKATEEISQQITTIQNETQEAVQSIEEIGTTIEQVNNYTGSISEAVQQQKLATAEISNSVQEAAMGTKAVSQDIEVVSNAVTDTNQVVDEVNAVSTDVTQCASGLSETVDRFLKNVAAA